MSKSKWEKQVCASFTAYKHSKSGQKALDRMREGIKRIEQHLLQCELVYNIYFIFFPLTFSLTFSLFIYSCLFLDFSCV